MLRQPWGVYHSRMSLTDEIKRLRRFIAIYKKLIHRPRNCPPRPEEKYHQAEFEFWQARLQMLEAERKQEKLLTKDRNRLYQKKRVVERELERRKSKL